VCLYPVNQKEGGGGAADHAGVTWDTGPSLAAGAAAG
jgi:hypothetical protein